MFNACRLIDVLNMAIDEVFLNITATYLPHGLQQILCGGPPTSTPSILLAVRSATGRACFGMVSAGNIIQKIFKLVSSTSVQSNETYIDSNDLQRNINCTMWAHRWLQIINTLSMVTMMPIEWSQLAQSSALVTNYQLPKRGIHCQQ